MDITPDIVLKAYATGIFPMADSAGSDHLYWYDPDPRGVLPIAGFHVPKRLRKTIRKMPFEIRTDTAFEDVIDGCAEATPERPETWINHAIREMFVQLYKMGYAHSVETWQDGKLVGGLYGLSLGGAFFGESMFSRRTDASKIALAHLVARLWAGGYTLLDTQFVTDHLRQFGAMEIPRDVYRQQLQQALGVDAVFIPAPAQNWQAGKWLAELPGERGGAADYSLPPSSPLPAALSAASFLASSGEGASATSCPSSSGRDSSDSASASSPSRLTEASLVSAFLQSITQTS